MKLIDERRDMKAMGMLKTSVYTAKSKEIQCILKKDKEKQTKGSDNLTCFTESVPVYFT